MVKLRGPLTSSNGTSSRRRRRTMTRKEGVERWHYPFSLAGLATALAEASAAPSRPSSSGSSAYFDLEQFDHAERIDMTGRGHATPPVDDDSLGSVASTPSSEASSSFMLPEYETLFARVGRPGGGDATPPGGDDPDDAAPDVFPPESAD
ncbi:MAG: hypothetical protein M1826_000887 [Phylliscum demangeonii]|nr:MAG: hypothetical protein M1826_000887 [Phylliscum demangeonii]